MCGEETLQAEAGCCPGHADHTQGLHGPAEVPSGKITQKKSLDNVLGSGLNNLLKSLIVSSAFARTQGSYNPEVHSGLVGPVLVQALPGGHRLPAVLHS